MLLANRYFYIQRYYTIIFGFIQAEKRIAGDWEIKGKVRGVVPPSIDVSDVEFEGALIVIYTKDPDKFAAKEDLIKQLAKMLQKRIAIRPDQSVITDTDAAEKKINKIIPKEAEITICA